MESILARALEYTLKYWLKSFSRDQFKLQGRTAQLSNLDINGDALHASIGLPPALNVTTARVGKLEITLPSVSNVQVEPILVQIDRLDLVLEENVDAENPKSPSSAQPASTSAKGSGYGFADKIADGMTLEVGTVNLMLETRGGAGRQGGATWSSPLASITIRNLLLYSTNENWQVVNLKEARDFSNNKKSIYVFKKLEWESLSVDLLPHPDMFMDTRLTSSTNPENKRDDDGAKRLFFGGERFLEGISGQAYITIQRTELNSPLGLEVQLHIPEAVCPALSEPGLRALLRFMTGLYVCLNRGDVDLKAQQRSTEAAGRSIVSVIVDHIFLCIRDSEFQLELLMQSLLFSRASVSDGETAKILSRIMIGGFFLRDTFSRPPCTLIQPSMRANAQEILHVPEFGQNFCPPIYPLGDQQVKFGVSVPLISLYSLKINPSPAPPKFASQTVVNCQPLMITLQEETCLRISSFLADGIVVNPGVVLPDFSVNSFQFTLKEFDLTVPLDNENTPKFSANGSSSFSSFCGARLHVEDLYFCESPSIKCTLLNLDKDPACFSLWGYQPIDASQKKWTTRASHLSLSLETSSGLKEQKISADWYEGLWRCVELHEACFEAAMVTADGAPLIDVPPPEGVVRIGIACEQYVSNASVEQLLFVLDLYAYFGKVSEKITMVSKGSKHKKTDELSGKPITKKLPSDTAVSLSVNNLHIKFMESSIGASQGTPLVQFTGQELFLKVSHRTLGGAFVVSTDLSWETVSIYCLDRMAAIYENDIQMSSGYDHLVNGNGLSQMRAVFWIDRQSRFQKKTVSFLDINAVHVMPYDVKDTESHSLSISVKISGVRLGGGMNYTEALLHQFGILGPDGGPGEGLLRGLKNISSGPLANLFRASPLIEADKQENGNLNEDHGGLLDLGMPDDVDVSISFSNWLFALESAEEVREGWFAYDGNEINREERCWHTTFQNLQLKAKSDDTSKSGRGKLASRKKLPFELITVSIEGLQALKPRLAYQNHKADPGGDKVEREMRSLGKVDNNGLDVEVGLVVDNNDDMMARWIPENIKFSVKEPIEAVATKEELEHLASLCRSEIDSMGRIAAGMLRLLKLDKSLGQGAMDQLTNLGSGSIDKILTPDKLSRRSSFGSICCTPRTPSHAIMEAPNETVHSTIALLEAEISDSQAKCSKLVSELSSSDISGHASDVDYLMQKLENMQAMLTKLRTLV